MRHFLSLGWERFLVGALLALGAACSSSSSEGRCAMNVDCPDGLVCNAGRCEASSAGPTCAPGRLACAADAECTSNKCEEGCCALGCASRLDCASGEECRAGVCRPAEPDQGCVQNADCTDPAKTRCKVATGACVSCLANADCDDPSLVCGAANTCVLAPGRCSLNGDCGATPGTPVCDTAVKRCVRCLQDVDCGTGATCLPDRTCLARPAGCDHDADCPTPAAPRCRADTRACVACTADADCSTDGTRRCNGQNRCEDVPPQGCRIDGDCANPSLPRCRTLDRECVRCLANADCASGERCLSDNTCAPAGTCTTNVDCAAPTAICTTDRACVECTQASHCGADKACHENICVVAQGGCASDAQCASPTKRCRTSDRTCVGCLVRDDCGPLQQCSQHACIPGPCSLDAECARVNAGAPLCAPDGRCVECLADAACGTGKVCRQNVCVLSGCGSDADCSASASTPRCETSSRTCVGCLVDGDCGSGRKCEQNRCVLAGCTSDAACAATPATPRCRLDSGACVACLADAECRAGYSCQANACAPVPGLDTTCNASSSCPSGLFCVGTSTEASCRAPCNVYAQNGSCPTDRRCAFVGYDGAGVPEGACVPATPSASGAGGVCSSTQKCDADLVCVYDSASAGKCRRLCDPASSAGCASPNKCQKLFVPDGTIPRTIGACFPDTKYLDPCPAPGVTCDGGLVCAAMPDPADPTRLRNLCDWPVGPRDGVAGCNDDGECKSGWCLDPVPVGVKDASGAQTTGSCQQGCASDTQCPAANGRAGACTSYPFLWPDASGSPSMVGVNSCVVQCKGEYDCKADDTCSLQANAARTTWVTRCVPGNASGSGFGGASCAKDADCWSGTCYRLGATTDGICMGVCDPTRTGSLADCESPGECPANGVLQTVTYGADGVYGGTDDVVVAAPLCWGKTCKRDVDCAGQSADPTKARGCSADPDPKNPKDIVLACAPRIGTKRPGDVCAADNECIGGWCVTWQDSTRTKTTKRCFGGCEPTLSGGTSSADCVSTAAAPTVCLDYTWTTTTPNKSHRLCLPTFP